MDGQYDNTDSGAMFPLRENEQVMLAGPINDNGEETRVVMMRSTLPDGRVIRDLYMKVGTLFDNSVNRDGTPNDTPNRPDFTGPFGVRRIGVWIKEKEDGSRYASAKLSDRGSPRMSEPAPQPQAQALTNDDIPF